MSSHFVPDSLADSACVVHFSTVAMQLTSLLVEQLCLMNRSQSSTDREENEKNI
jgi:hypothetical protein